MKKRYLLFLLLVFSVLFFTKSGLIKAQEMVNPYPADIASDSTEQTIEPHYNIFYKIDEEENTIDNAEFVIRDFNNDVKYSVSYDKNLKAYKYVEYIEQDYQKSLSLLLSKEKNIISNFNKKDDFIPYITGEDDKPDKYIDVHCNWSPTNVEIDEEVPKANVEIERESIERESNILYYCDVSIPTFMILEETKTPKGYEKETAVVVAIVKMYYEFDNASGLVNNKMSRIQFDGEFIKYDENVDYSNLSVVESFTEEYIDSMLYDRVKCESSGSACDGCAAELPTCPGPSCEQEAILNDFAMSESHMREIKLSENDSNFELKCLTPIIVDKKGSSALTVNSYVNSKEEVNLTESSNVEIKVFLKNSGKAPSYENKVVSNVPEGVEYVSGSASDNGVYDEENNIVTWDLDYLDASSGYIFSYEVAVTTGSKESVYVTTSSVSSEDNETPIVSNEAKVTTPGLGGDAPEEEEKITNPETGDDLNFALILGLLIGSIVLISIKNRKPLGL